MKKQAFCHWQAFCLSTIKIHALTRKTLVKIKKNPVTSFLLVSGVEKLHWQAFCLSTNHKDIKIHALTRKTLVKNQKKWKWMVEAFYCWQVFYLSMISKNKDFPENYSNFIAWQVKLLSTLRAFFEVGMHLACTDKNFSCQWMKNSEK